MPFKMLQGVRRYPDGADRWDIESTADLCGCHLQVRQDNPRHLRYYETPMLSGVVLWPLQEVYIKIRVMRIRWSQTTLQTSWLHLRVDEQQHSSLSGTHNCRYFCCILAYCDDVSLPVSLVFSMSPHSYLIFLSTTLRCLKRTPFLSVLHNFHSHQWSSSCPA